MPEESNKSVSVVGLIIEFLIVVAVGLAILFFFLYGHAFHRGFHCDDESLRYPYKDSTVPSFYLYIFGIGLNLIAMIIGEYSRGKHDKSKIMVWKWEVPKWTYECYKAFIIFCFGAACSQLITDSLKYTIGRLRPHFYTVCQPIFNGINCEKLTTNLHMYITDYKCNNSLITPRQLKEMRLSFPSGHSSFGMFTMLYCALYIGARFNWRDFKTCKHIIQYVVVLAALWVAMTRVSDYKHHWSDVLAGLSIGVVSSVVTGIFVAKLYQKDKSYEKPEPNQNGGSHPV